MKKRLISLLLVLVLLIGIAPLALGWDHPFTDLAEITSEALEAQCPDAWAAVFISEVYREGIMRGTSPTTFSPSDGFSREMVVTTLFRMYHDRIANASDSRATPFEDVSVDAWSAPYISWAFREGIVTGVSPTRFGRGTPISFQDFAVMLYRFANFSGVGASAPDYADLDSIPYGYRTGSWARDAFTWAMWRGIMSSELIVDRLDPTANVSRAQSAGILFHYLEYVRHQEIEEAQ